MDVPKMRPTFEIGLPIAPDDAVNQMRAQLRDEFRECTTSAGRCVDLFVSDEERHFWSPHLSVQVEEEESGSRLYARFGPHPEVWTMFVFLYSAVGFAALLGVGWGYAQWISGRPPWALLVVPGAAAVAALLYLGSRVGQRLGRDQMSALRTRLEWLIAGMA